MKSRITTTLCPTDSHIRSFLTKIDFEDAYAFQTAACSESIEEVYIKIFTTAPAWVVAAMRLRNLLVSPFGLKTEMDKRRPISLKEGEKTGIFRIYRIFENEVVAGENDKHLDFRVSVHRSANDSSTITVSTLVQYNNAFGKMYMSLIAPFHKMVVKSLLKSSLQRFHEKE